MKIAFSRTLFVLLFLQSLAFASQQDLQSSDSITSSKFYSIFFETPEKKRNTFIGSSLVLLTLVALYYKTQSKTSEKKKNKKRKDKIKKANQNATVIFDCPTISGTDQDFHFGDDEKSKKLSFNVNDRTLSFENLLTLFDDKDQSRIKKFVFGQNQIGEGKSIQFSNIVLKGNRVQFSVILKRDSSLDALQGQKNGKFYCHLPPLPNIKKEILTIEYNSPNQDVFEILKQLGIESCRIIFGGKGYTDSFLVSHMLKLNEDSIDLNINFKELNGDENLENLIEKVADINYNYADVLRKIEILLEDQSVEKNWGTLFEKALTIYTFELNKDLSNLFCLRFSDLLLTFQAYNQKKFDCNGCYIQFYSQSSPEIQNKLKKVGVFKKIAEGIENQSQNVDGNDQKDKVYQNFENFLKKNNKQDYEWLGFLEKLYIELLKVGGEFFIPILDSTISTYEEDLLYNFLDLLVTNKDIFILELESQDKKDLVLGVTTKILTHDKIFEKPLGKFYFFLRILPDNQENENTFDFIELVFESYVSKYKDNLDFANKYNNKPCRDFINEITNADLRGRLQKHLPENRIENKQNNITENVIFSGKNSEGAPYLMCIPKE